MKFSYVPAYGFGKSKKGELEKNDQLTTPGPGKYDFIKNTIHQPTWKIGTSSQRPSGDNTDNPGPGSYNIRFKFPDGPCYSILTRPKENAEKFITPGPSNYKPNTAGKSPSSYTFGRRYKPNTTDMTPGPGSYNIRKAKDLTKPSSIFGHEKRMEVNNRKATPGPGNYNSNINNINIHHPQYSFGKGKRIEDKFFDYPGPGAYKSKEYVGKEGKHISMGLRYKGKSSSDLLPGPGQYKVKTYDCILKKLPNVTIGKAKRFSTNDIYSDNGPGPGQYNDVEKYKYVKNTKPSWKIGKSLRRPLNDQEGCSPGPGRYNISVGSGSPIYSIRNRNKEGVDRNITPGPGRYDNSEFNTYKHYPTWKIGTSKRDDDLKRQIRDGYPGPGTYQSLNKHLKSSPKYGFGTQKRYKDKFDDNPGPGSYHIPCSIIEVNDYTREQGVFDEKFKYI